MKSTFLVACAAFLAAGCASYDGHSLVAGKDTESDVTRLMGAPNDTVKRSNGDKVLFYSRQPEGREIYAAVIAPDGSLRQIGQTLVPANIRKVSMGMSREQVHEILGPPARTTRYQLKPFDVWEYRWLLGADRRVLWVGIADDGTVRDVTDLHDYEWEPNSGPGFP